MCQAAQPPAGAITDTPHPSTPQHLLHYREFWKIQEKPLFQPSYCQGRKVVKSPEPMKRQKAQRGEEIWPRSHSEPAVKPGLTPLAVFSSRPNVLSLVILKVLGDRKRSLQIEARPHTGNFHQAGCLIFRLSRSPCHQSQARGWKANHPEDDDFPFFGFISNLAAETPIESSSCGLEPFLLYKTRPY